VRRYVQRRRELSATEDLHEVLLSREPALDEHVERDVGNTQRREGVEVHRGVLDAERVGEALQLGDALEERQLAALEAGWDLATGLLTLGATSGRLAAAATDTTTDDLLALDRASVI